MAVSTAVIRLAKSVVAAGQERHPNPLELKQQQQQKKNTHVAKWYTTGLGPWPRFPALGVSKLPPIYARSW